MYQEQFNLSSKDILEKEFKIDTRGYRLKEVDQYLDLIISDYEQFFKILKDKDTSPVSKHFACNMLMDIAMKIKDPELYFIAARAKGKLEATEDLTILGVEKGSTFTLDWCDKVENLLKARNDPKYFDICVKQKLSGRKEPISKDIIEKAITLFIFPNFILLSSIDILT